MHGLPHAARCLVALGAEAVDDLAAALADRSRWAPTKAIMMLGVERGYALHTEEGMQAWMRVVQEEPLPSWINLKPASGLAEVAPRHAAPPRSRPSAEARAKRRQARQARKRNR